MSKGLDLVHSGEDVDPNAYSVFTNATTIYEGALTGRSGLSSRYTLPASVRFGSVHSLRSLGPNVLVGVETSLAYVGTSSGVVSSRNDTDRTGWEGSGDVISMVPWRPTKQSQAWMYLMDGTYGRKFYIDEVTRATYKCFGIGIFPNMTDLITSADVTDNSGGGSIEDGDYDWRYTYYNSHIGCESNPNTNGDMIEGDTVTLSHGNDNSVTITIVKTLDSQVDKVRLYRRGGLLSDWYWVQDYSISTAAYLGETTTITDTLSCEIVAGAAIILSEDNDVPFTTIDKETGEILYGRPLRILFGPYMGKYMFGLGDSNRPGFLYWTNPFNPDAAAAFNVLEISPPTEPLINGCVYNGVVYVFTHTSVYKVYPSVTGSNTFTSEKIFSGAGIWPEYALAVGPSIWFVGKNAIYQLTGDGVTNITDASFVRPIFYLTETENGHPGIDWDAADLNNKLRLEYQDPYLHITYPTTEGNCVALHYHTLLNRWEPWDIDLGSSVNPTCLYSDEYSKDFLVGTDNGNILYYHGYTDVGSAIPVTIMTGFYSQEAPRSIKDYGDAFIEFDPKDVQISVTPYINEDLNTPLATQTLPVASGRQRTIIPIRNAGNDYGAVKGRSVAFKLAWSASTAPPVLYELNMSYLERPVERTVRETDWDDADHPVEKYVKGVIIDCDTGNLPKVITIQGDGESKVYAQTIEAPVNAGGDNQSNRRIVELSWPWFQAKLLRIVSSDVNPWIIYKITWLFDQMPPGISSWDTGWASLDWPYEKYIKGVSIECDTYDKEKVLQLRIDGRDDVYVTEFGIQCNGRNIYMHHFDNVLAREVKLVAMDDNPGQLYNVKWIWDREPANILVQQTQEATFNSKGFAYMREFYMGLRSNATVNCDWTVDGMLQHSEMVPSTDGDREKVKVELPAVKGKNFKFKFYSCLPFKLYLEDSEVRIKEWNADIGWKVYQLPFEGGDENP